VRGDDENGFLRLGDDEDAEDGERDGDEGDEEEDPSVVGYEKGSSEDQTDDLEKTTRREVSTRSNFLRSRLTHVGDGSGSSKAERRKIKCVKTRRSRCGREKKTHRARAVAEKETRREVSFVFTWSLVETGSPCSLGSGKRWKTRFVAAGIVKAALKT